MVHISHKLSPTSQPNFSLAEQLFGDDFEVWARDSQWHRTKTMGQRWEQLSVDFYLQLIELLQKTARSSQVKFHDLDQHRALCLVPLEDPQSEHEGMVALSIVDRMPPSILDLAQRAASAAVLQQKHSQRVQQKLSHSDSQLAAYSTRINRGEGELAWLHGLAGSAVLAATDNDPRRIAERILPDMGRLINARAIAFLPYPNDNALAATPLNIWQSGDVPIPAETCLSMIAEHGTAEEAVVYNYDVPAFRSETFFGVLSCIVKKVVSHTCQVGWILVVNKDLQYLEDSNVLEVFGDAVQPHCGFGMLEASLVDAAANAMAAHARNCRLLAEKEALVDGTIRSLVNAIDAKDSYTCGHSDRVAVYARQIAETMQLDQQFCDRIYMTGLVHDVGKIGVPDSVLQKPGKLTDEEFDSIKQHPTTGHSILEHLEDFSYVLTGVLHHHEAVDGSGYPFGLKGDNIPLAARILAVADAYDAMTSDRPYRDGMPTEKAESIIADGAGKQWDSGCVTAFQNCIDRIRRVAHERHDFVSKPSFRFPAADSNSAGEQKPRQNQPISCSPQK